MTTTDDNLTAGDDDCTLWEAIANANADSDTTGGDCAAGSGVDTVMVPAGTYTLTLSGAGEDGNLSGDLDLTDADATTIQGEDTRTTLIDGDAADTVIDVAGGAVAVLNDLTLQDGFGSRGEVAGGGLFGNSGSDITLRRVRITGNTTSSGRDAAGIGGDGLTLTIDECLIDNNIAAEDGGGLELGGTITNTTISNNVGRVGGGLRLLSGTLTLVNVTVTGNRTTNGVGGGLARSAGTLEYQGSIIASNVGPDGTSPQDCGGVVSSLGGNLLGQNGDPQGCMVGMDTVLDGDISTAIDVTLADNGGPTDTHALVTDGPAVDQIPDGMLGCGTTIISDQIGTSRLGTCDIGAFEIPPVPIPMLPEWGLTLLLLGVGVVGFVVLRRAA
ncbi:MAG: choice-of-anchor Q domain-containing protein [Acidobacteriota bacterium]